MSGSANTGVATITRVEAPKTSHTVHFNPASLKISLSNRVQDDGAASKQAATPANGQTTVQPAQSPSVTTSKLETELIYDTTETGTDVRDVTGELRKMATIVAPKEASLVPEALPKVEFRWGLFKFVGVIESLNETLDFWAAEGVPLRATVQLVLQGQQVEKDNKTPAIAVTLNSVAPVGVGTTRVATLAGDPGAGRAIAAANGIEDMRMAAGGAVAVSAGVQLQAAAAFSVGASVGAGIGIGASAGASAGLGFGIGASASAGAGVGIGASAGFGASAAAGFGASASAGFGTSAGAGFSAGASASFGASASTGFGASASAGFGASASAGFRASASAGFGAGAGASFSARSSAGASATAGAFAGLGSSKTTLGSVRLDPARLMAPPQVQVGSATQFDVTGRAIATGSSGLTAHVTGHAGIRFE